MALPITALYAAALGLLMVALAAHVIMLRGQTSISINDGGNTALAERIRRHGNFTENVPMALILMGLAESGGTDAPWLHAVGGLLLAGRLVHPFGISAANAALPARIAGQSMTLLSIVVGAGLILLPRVFG